MQFFDTSRPGTYLLKSGGTREAFLIGSGAVCYYRRNNGAWFRASSARFTLS